jgi:hypothetical protein
MIRRKYCDCNNKDSTGTSDAETRALPVAQRAAKGHRSRLRVLEWPYVKLCVWRGGLGLFIFPSNYEIEAYAAPKYNEANRDITYRYEKDSTGTGTYIAGRY